MKALLEKRNTLAKEIRRLAELANDEKHTWSAEDQENWTRVNADFDAVQAEITAETDRQLRTGRLAEVDELLNAQIPEPRVGLELDQGTAPGTDGDDGDGDGDGQGDPQPRAGNRGLEMSPEDRALTLQAWCRADTEIPLSPQHIAACQRHRINPAAGTYLFGLRTDYRTILRELRAMGTGAGAGGETIPEGFVNRLEIAMATVGPVQAVAEVLRTLSGNKMPWPTIDDTSQEGEQVDQGIAVAEQDVVTAGMDLEAYKYSSKMVKVNYELLEDSAFNMANVLADLLGERLGRIKNNRFTLGTGTAQAKGIVVAATAFAAAGVAAITGDDVLGLVHSVDAAYRMAPSTGFMCNDAIILAIRKLKDGQGNYLWQTDFTSGQPGRLLGYPTHPNNHMASTIVASAKTLIFGKLNAYKVREVRGIRLRRLVERYAEADQVAFVAFVRADGDLLDAGTHPVKVLTQPAV